VSTSRGAPVSTSRVAVIGVGNEYRRDDGVGAAVIAYLQLHDVPDVEFTVADGEPSQLIEAWSGARLAVVVDAVLCEPPNPGRIHRTSLEAMPSGAGIASTHGLGIPDAMRLAEVLDRAPQRLVVYAVEAADLGFGVGLSPALDGVIPKLASAILTEVTEVTEVTADAAQVLEVTAVADTSSAASKSSPLPSNS